jgi:hypothetical protein
MNYKNDELELNQADLRRKNSAPSIVIGTDERVCIAIFSFRKKERIKSYRDQPTTRYLNHKFPKPHSIH